MRALVPWIAGLSMIVAFSPTGAHAARLARVKVEGAQVYDKPSSSARVLGSLPRGTLVATGNAPTQGFYRMKTKTGLLGWIAADALQFKAAGSRARKSGPVDVPPSRPDPMKARLFASLSLFNVSDVHDYLGFNSLKAGIGFGGELAYAFLPKLSGVLRVERISKSVTVLSPDGTQSYLINVASLPIMVGAEYELISRGSSDEKGFTLDVALLAGMGLGTKLTVTSSDYAAPNTTVWGGSTFTFYPKINANVYLSRSFALVGEAGYRILNAAAASPTETSGEATTVLFSAVPPSFAVNLNGIVLGAGLSYSF